MRQKLWILGALTLSIGVGAFLPVVDHLPHPASVSLRMEEGVQLPMSLRVVGYDFRLNTNYVSHIVEFDAAGNATVPDVQVHTALWHLGLKRVLTHFDAWTKCENCYGLMVECSLKLKDGFRPPENTRIAQNRAKEGKRLLIKVSLIPNEDKFAPRVFSPSNAVDLVTEARNLVAKGNTPNVPRSSFGPQLAYVNPVRVECLSPTLILWMGGNLGYALSPDSESCPTLNMTWVTGTEYPHIFKLEKMSELTKPGNPQSGTHRARRATNQTSSAPAPTL